jgi:hypothetical protein
MLLASRSPADSVSRPVRVDLAEVLRRLEDRRQKLRRQQTAQHAANVAVIARAARLTPMPSVGPQGALTSREAASPARETASTTTTHAGGLSGCSTQSA